MMMFAKQAACHFKRSEIIEYHHDQKKDAPSGTAIKTADCIADSGFSSDILDETELIDGARGGAHRGIPIHSVRVPGVIANQDVIFGGIDETFTLSHRSLSRRCFMPGVLLVLRRLGAIEPGLVYGMEGFVV